MDLIDRLESDNMEGISIDLLSSLLKYFSTDEEMLMFKKAGRAEVKRSCDILCWEAARRSTLKIRTELAVAREQILQDLSRHTQSTQSMRAACSAFRSKVLVHLMHKCLQYGNYINQGTALPRAVGFSLSSLPSVLGAKEKKRAMVRMPSLSTASDRQQATRDRLSVHRRNLQPNRMTAEEMRDLFLEVANQ